jgi:hypothetical protein
MSGRIRLRILTVSMFLLSCASVPPATAGGARGKYFDRVITVVFENTGYQNAMKQPFFAQLAGQGANFTRFSAETHPSQANYIALTSGSLQGVKGDGKYNLGVRHIADLLEEGGHTWKVYAEGYPGGCYLGTTKGRYARKHNPFISYVNIQRSPARCANVVNASQFYTDAAAGNLPEYVFYVPDLSNDGHDTGAAYADAWYRKSFGPLLNDPKAMAGTLLVTTFDENEGAAGNFIYTTLYGEMVKSGPSAAPLNHYSLLRLVEDNWDLGNLGREDARANPLPDIWR